MSTTRSAGIVIYSGSSTMCSPQWERSFSAIPFDDGVLIDLVGESERKRVTCTCSVPGNGELGVEIFKRLTGWLESGAIVPSRLVVIPGRLAGMAAGCERRLTWGVGAKLRVHIGETLREFSLLFVKIHGA